jgi:hypothetical protein
MDFDRAMALCLSIAVFFLALSVLLMTLETWRAR